jgi:carbonic anhydrase
MRRFRVTFGILPGLMSATDDVLRGNQAYAASFEHRELPTPPAKKLVVVTCMDSRIDVQAMLGMKLGEAHILRNAGGLVTDDTIRSLALSQRMLGTEEVMLIHHTRCGLHGVSDDEVVEQLEQETGVAPGWKPGGFADVDEDVRESIARVRASPFLPHTDRVRGFVYDVDTGRLREVE